MGVAEWFFLQGMKEAGPFTRDQIKSLFSSGTITEETPLWRPGYSDWRPLSAFSEFEIEPPRPSYVDNQRRRGRLQAAPRQRELPTQHTAVAREAPALVHSRQWIDVNPHPWRRYFARYLDNILWSMMIMFLLSVGLAYLSEPIFLQFFSLLEGPGGQVISLVIATILAVIPNAILIGLTGGNLGKWLFGICVLDEADRPIGVIRSFKREGRVLLFGLAFGIPFLSLISMIISYQKLKQDRSTSWDEALAVKVVHRKAGVAQYIGSTIGIILILGLFGLIAWLNRLSLA